MIELEGKADQGNGNGKDFERGKEIGAMAESIKALAGSLDDLREELKDMRKTMATKDDVDKAMGNCSKCSTICNRIGDVERDLYGKDADGKESGRPGLIQTTTRLRDQAIEVGAIVAVLLALFSIFSKPILAAFGVHI